MKLVLGVLAGVGALAGVNVVDYKTLGYSETVVGPDDTSHIPYIRCTKDDGGAGQASGVYIGDDVLLTADHVARNPSCTADGQPAQRMFNAPDLDFAMMRAAQPADRIRDYSCAPLRAGKIYVAQGYVGNAVYRISVAYSGFGNAEGVGGFRGAAIFLGPVQFIPGMSGGEIYDPETGKLVATVVGYNTQLKLVSYGRSLRDTHLCSPKNARS